MKRFIILWQLAVFSPRLPSARLLVCVILAACLVRASLAAAQPPRQAIPPEIFWQQVDQTIAWLDSSPDATSPEWQTRANRWEEIREVVLDGQRITQVDTSYIVHLMRTAPPDRDKLSAYLLALKETRSLTTRIGGEREMQLLKDILARPEFQSGSEGPNFIQKIIEWLLHQYARLMDLLFGQVDADIGIPSEVTIPFTLLIILAILAFIFRDTLRNLFNEAELADDSPGEGEILSARLAAQKAQELSRGGDYRHALRYLYLSALLLLDERGLLRYNRTQTNREYLRQVRERPALAERLKIVVETFDRVWYGYQPIDEASYARYVEQVSALEETRE